VVYITICLRMATVILICCSVPKAKTRLKIKPETLLPSNSKKSRWSLLHLQVSQESMMQKYIFGHSLLQLRSRAQLVTIMRSWLVWDYAIAYKTKEFMYAPYVTTLWSLFCEWALGPESLECLRSCLKYLAWELRVWLCIVILQP